MKDCFLNCRLWFEKLKDDKRFVDELSLIKDNNDEIISRFCADLSFGTAGARALMGVGSSRMNFVTVSHISQSYSEYLKRRFKLPSVVVSYDTRKYSKEFAYYSSEVFAANGIQVYIFKNPSPIGILSFAIRKMNCSGGVMITASHNPPEYNGYKIYNDMGAQPVDVSEISSILSSIDIFDFKRKDFDCAFADGKIKFVDDCIEKEYLELIKEKTKVHLIKNLDITYSPLNGCALDLFCGLFDLGKNLHVVEEQKYPDCEFSTCKRPDPQNLDSFKLSFNLARKNNSDIIILNDPDGDRLGVSVKDGEGYLVLTGLEISSLLLDFIIKQSKDKNKICLIKSVVSGGLCDKISEFYGLKCIQTLPGFKYISEKMHEMELNNTLDLFSMGFEESNGFLLFPFIRDKDGVSSSAFFCKMVSYYKENNLSCSEVLEGLYKKFGYNLQKNISFKENNKNRINYIIDKFKFYFLNDTLNVSIVNDYRTSESHIIESNKIKSLDIEKSEILEIIFKDGNKLFLRSSGTEPLLKFYIMYVAPTRDLAEKVLDKIEKVVLKIYKSVTN